uniref:SWIM-type domain-containing protein n=1 Tax=Panagrolaimus davidi TaxID=227884 RepID=A0A914QEH4_9BILA
MATCYESEDEDIYDRPVLQSVKDSHSDNSCTNLNITEKVPEISCSVQSHTVHTNDVKYETSVIQSDKTFNDTGRRKKKKNAPFFLGKKTDTTPSQDKNSADNFKRKKKRKTSGEAAVEAWRLEEKQFDQADKQRKKYIAVRRGVLSNEAFEAMANANLDVAKKPKIKKKEKPQLTEKILKVLIAVGDGKLNHYFNESEVARVSIMQSERVKFLKKLSQKEELRWYKILFRRIYKGSYFTKELKNVKLLYSRIDDLDFVLCNLEAEEIKKDLNSIAASLEKLNLSFEKDVDMEYGDDATKMEEDDNERASAIIDLIMKCGQQNQYQEKEESSRPGTALSGGGHQLFDSDEYSSSGSEKDDAPDKNRVSSDDSSEKADGRDKSHVSSDEDEVSSADSDDVTDDSNESQKKKKKKKQRKIGKHKKREKLKKKKRATRSSASSSVSENEAEAEFNHFTCLPTADGDEISNTAYTSLEADQYRKVFEYVSKNDRFFGVHPALHPHGGFLAAYKLDDIRDKKDLNARDAKKEIYTDGYTWMANDGRMELQKAKKTGVFRNQWRGGNEKKEAVDFRKWLIDCNDFPGIFLLHYFGKHKKCAKGAIHGNAVYTKKKFFAILPSARRTAVLRAKSMKPKKIYSMSQYDKTDDPPALARLRNLDQAHYAAKIQNMQNKCTPNALFNCMLLSQYCTKVVLLGALVHLTKEAVNHEAFLKNFYTKHEKRLKKHRFMFITDEEFHFNRIWPNATHMYCSLHLLRNMERALVAAGVAVEERNICMNHFRNLRDVRTHEEFDELRTNILHDSNFATEKQKEIFQNYVDKLRNRSSLASFLANKSVDIDALYYMEGCIKYKMEDSVTSNPAESLNALFQAQIDKRELAIDELAYAIYYFAGVFYNDIIRGYYDDGNFELLKKYSSKKKGSAFQIPENKLMKLPEFADFNKWIIEQEGPVFEGEQNIDLRKALLVTAIDNFKIYHLEDDVFTVIDTVTKRKATVTLGETARKDECTCRQRATCLHILAAKKLIGKELTANKLVGDPMKDEKRQRNKKVGRHGRKRRQRKEVVGNSDESSEAVLSPVQKAAKKRNDDEHASAMRNIRAYIKQVTKDFYSLKHRPSQMVEIADENQPWFSNINSPQNTICSNIFKGTFIEPLPVLSVKESCFGSTTDDAYFLVSRDGACSVTVIAIGGAFSNNCIDELYLHSSMVARDQEEDVLVTVFLHDGVFEQKAKLVLLSLFNVMVSQQSFSNPVKLNDISHPDDINMNYINLVSFF